MKHIFPTNIAPAFLQVQVTGYGSATGSLSMGAGFGTQALLEFGLQGTTFVEVVAKAAFYFIILLRKNWNKP